MTRLDRGRVLILGGARSGKSRHGEGLVEASGLEPVHVATAEADDAEMAARITEHRSRRGPGWLTVEAPCDLAGALEREAAGSRALLVDCLTLWLSNLMLRGGNADEAGAHLAGTAKRLPGLLVFVSNEVGLGLVPDTALGRAFRDAQGALNQGFAAISDRVVFMAAGLPLTMKGQDT